MPRLPLAVGRPTGTELLKRVGDRFRASTSIEFRPDWTTGKGGSSCCHRKADSLGAAPPGPLRLWALTKRFQGPVQTCMAGAQTSTRWALAVRGGCKRAAVGERTSVRSD